jgi:hypothetical protein
MKPSLLLCATLAAALALPVGAADGKKRKPPLFTAGVYSGEAADGARIDFQATKRSVLHFAFSDLTVKCTDGQERFAGQRDSARASVSRRTGRFEGSDTQFGFTYDVKGKLKSKKASGTLSVTYRTEPEGGLSPNGPITCSSGPVKWRATTY